MKKFILSLIVIFSLAQLNAQGTIKLGVKGGISLNDAEKISDGVMGVDAYYLFKKKRAFLNIGPTIGFRNYFTNDAIDDAQFINIGAAGRVRVLGMSAGIDAGYAIGLNNYLDGGFYLRPLVGFTLELTIVFQLLGLVTLFPRPYSRV